MSNTPDDYAIHVVEKKMSVDQLILILYKNPTPLIFQHFKTVNQHLEGGIVRPGQIVLISPPNSSECTIGEAAFLEAARKVDSQLRNMGNSERELLASRYELISNIASYNGLLLGVAHTGWKAHINQVEAILKEIEAAYVRTYNSNGRLSKQSFFTFRKAKFVQLNHALSRLWAPSIGGSVMPGNLKQNLGLSTKSMVHQWKKMGGPASSIPDFVRNYEQVGRMANNLKRLGYLGIALDGVQSVANIQKACAVSSNSDICTKTKYTETGRFSGSVSVGIFGGGVTAYATCNLVFGLPSGGTSLLWCSIVAGAAGGYAGSQLGGYGGTFIGKKAYELR